MDEQWVAILAPRNLQPQNADALSKSGVRGGMRANFGASAAGSGKSLIDSK